MEFWGIEIKPGKPVKVEPEDGYIIHVSQVSLGEWKKGEEDVSVPVFVEVGDDKQKLVIGNLSQNIPQVFLDLIFEREFELSHNSKTTSVFLLGYKSPDLDPMDEDEEDFDSEEEGMPAMDFFEKGMNGEKAKTEADESDSEDEDESDSEEEDEAPLLVEPPSKKMTNGGAMNKAVASKKGQQKKGKKTGCQFPCGSSCRN